MKTLQQEIVEALRKASGTARKYAKQYDEFALSYHEYMDQSKEFDELAAKVESARCENCASRECDAGWCGFIWAHVDPGFACLSFEQKVESK